MRFVLVLLLALAALSWPRAAVAQACSANIQDAWFGNLTSLAQGAEVERTLAITCNNGPANDAARICLGIQPSGSPRRMLGGSGDAIAYEIRTDGGQVWDQNLQLTMLIPLNSAGSGSATMTLHARIPPTPDMPPSGFYQSPVPGETVFGLVKPGNSPCHSGGSSGTLASAMFNASVLINGTCDITAAPLLDFGVVGGTTTPQLDGALQLTAQCTTGLPYSIGLNAGQVPGNTIANRRLGLDGAGPEVIGYQLYLDAGRSQVWGDGTSGAVHNATGTGTSQGIAVYGRIPAGQPLPAGGTYRDTVTATIVY